MNSFFQKIKKVIDSKIFLYFISVLILFLLFITLYRILGIRRDDIPDPNEIVTLLLIDLILILSLGFIFLRKFIKSWNIIKNLRSSSTLRSKIIMVCSVVSIVPTIIVASFSVFFFNFGMQSWFNQRMDKLLSQSINVANSYIKEHRISLNSSVYSMSEYLAAGYADLILNPHLFNQVLNAQADISGIDEAIVFQKNGNILAKTLMSFSLSFANIPTHILQKAQTGRPIEFSLDNDVNGKIRILIKLREYQDSYLLVGKFIDSKVLDYIDKTKGAAEDYKRLKNQSSSIQIKFSIVFVIVALLLLISSIVIGVMLALQITKPIISLVNATEKLKNGDWSVRVSQQKNTDDEISALSSAFNTMVETLSHQQKDLALAQRSAAWADVARRVAHEIKNPLTPIQLSAERLKSKYSNSVDEPERFIKYVSTILRHTDDIRKIVSEFVNFTKLPNPIFEKCDLVKIVKDLVESRSLISDQVKYYFTSNIDSCPFVSDLTQINQVIVNLLKNAEEALENISSAQVNVDIYGEFNEIGNKNDIEFVVLTISDNGKGFPPELIERITEPYLTTRTKGTGLGLSIVKKIVQDHSGVIEISNGETGGAVVKLIFDVIKLRENIKS